MENMFYALPKFFYISHRLRDTANSSHIHCIIRGGAYQGERDGERDRERETERETETERERQTETEKDE